MRVPASFTVSLLTLTSLLRGDLHTLQQICCEGLLRSFEGRIAVRPRARRLRWRVTKSLKRPKLVSHNAALSSAGPTGFGIRQAVIRLITRQELETFNIQPAKGPELPESRVVGDAEAWRQVVEGGTDGPGSKGDGGRSSRTEEKTEYVVVQKVMRDGREGEWTVWGTVKESYWRSLLKIDTDSQR